MLFKSEVVTQASGSVGGVTYSHTRSGMYRRARAIPVQPGTAQQLAAKNALAAAAAAWGALTDAQREAWGVYASNVPLINALGSPFLASGQNMYIRSQAPLNQLESAFALGLAPYADAPPIFDLGDFTTPSFSADVVTGITVTLNTADAWASETESSLYVYQGRPFNATRNFFKGPFRLVGSIQGTPAVSPLIIPPAMLNAIGYTLVDGQKCCIRVAVSREDARRSNGRLLPPVIVTP